MVVVRISAAGAVGLSPLWFQYHRLRHNMHQNRQGRRQMRASKAKAKVIFVTLSLTCHHIYHVLFVKSKSFIPAHIQRKGVYTGYEFK